MQDFLGVIDKHFVPAGLPVFALLESLTNTQRFDQTIMFLEDAVSALALLQNLIKIFLHIGHVPFYFRKTWNACSAHDWLGSSGKLCARQQ